MSVLRVGGSRGSYCGRHDVCGTSCEDWFCDVLGGSCLREGSYAPNIMMWWSISKCFSLGSGWIRLPNDVGLVTKD